MQARNCFRKLVIFNLIRPSTHCFLNEYFITPFDFQEMTS